MAEGEWMWHGAALAANGCIYGIPSNGERVLKVEVATGDVSYVGSPMVGRNKWYVRRFRFSFRVRNRAVDRSISMRPGVSRSQGDGARLAVWRSL